MKELSIEPVGEPFLLHADGSKTIVEFEKLEGEPTTEQLVFAMQYWQNKFLLRELPRDGVEAEAWNWAARQLFAAGKSGILPMAKRIQKMER